MATLLGAMIENPENSPALLEEAASMLLQPFEGIPEEGSIYGDATSTLEEKAEKYEAAMSERIARARTGGSEAQAAALESMLTFVLDELGFEQTPDDDAVSGGDEIASKMAAALASEDDGDLDELMRLRGGRRGGGGASALLDDPELRQSLDNVPRATEKGASQLRKNLKPLFGGPTATDYAFSGAFVGFATGKILIGDPKLLAVAGASAFAYSHRWPEKTDRRLRAFARRAAELTHEARTHFTQHD